MMWRSAATPALLLLGLVCWLQQGRRVPELASGV
jgi:hypothetical protein